MQRCPPQPTQQEGRGHTRDFWVAAQTDVKPLWVSMAPLGLPIIGHTTAQHSTSQHSTSQHITAHHIIAQHSTSQHSTAQHTTAQHITADHSTAHHSTAQHSTAQHSTAHHGTSVPCATSLSHQSLTGVGRTKKSGRLSRLAPWKYSSISGWVSLVGREAHTLDEHCTR